MESGEYGTPVAGLPHPVAAEVKLLGIQVDQFGTLDVQLLVHRTRAQVR